MSKFRRKAGPVVHAQQIVEGQPLPRWVSLDHDGKLLVATSPFGKNRANYGDWVIEDQSRWVEIMSDHIFRELYEPVDEVKP